MTHASTSGSTPARPRSSIRSKMSASLGDRRTPWRTSMRWPQCGQCPSGRSRTAVSRAQRVERPISAAMLGERRLAERRVGEGAELLAHPVVGVDVLGLQLGDALGVLARVAVALEDEAEGLHVLAGLARRAHDLADGRARTLAVGHVASAQRRQLVVGAIDGVEIPLQIGVAVAFLLLWHG